MNRKVLPLILLLLGLLSTTLPLPANEGYWVLDKNSVTGGGGSKAFQFKVGKHSATVASTGSSDGTSFSWTDLPEKIRFGDEAKLGIPVEINCPDPATRKLMQRTPHMMSLTVTVDMWDPYECKDYTRNNNPYRWRTEVTESGTVTRRPDVDMHEDRFTPTSESTLTITVVASLNTPITVDGQAVSGLSGGRTYVYKYVGDKPIYGIETEGTVKPGEFGKTEIPPALFWIGGTLIGIAGANQIRKNLKKKKKGGSDPEPEPEQQPERHPSTFRMILYKEFGDTLRAGDAPKVVGARIEELTHDGRVLDRPDLTRTIRVIEGENIQLLSTGFDGRYMCGSVCVPEAQQSALAAKGSVLFHFETPTGILRNHVVFHIEDNKKIVFTQQNITFVAGQQSAETVYFYVVGIGDAPSFDVTIEGDDKKTFEVISQVRPDRDGSWSVDLKDRLTEIPGQMAGNMDNCYLAVTARQTFRDGERKITERLPVHRFYEGLRMVVDHVKAYAVVAGTESIDRTEEILKSQDQTLRENQSLKGMADWDESGVSVVPAHTRLELTPFAWNKEKNMIGSPSPRDVSIVFEDVSESLEWFGKKGAEITEPVRALGFKVEQFGIDSRPISQHADLTDCRTTTYVYEIIPSAIMVPPNRCKVAITASASYDGRSFEDKQTLMVISMPMRYAPDMQSLTNMMKFDAQVQDRLVMMITRLTSLRHAPEFNALICKCRLLLDSFDERFGFYMPDFYTAKSLYLRTMRGEVGPLYVAEHSYSWEEVYFGDAFNMCMETFEEHEPKTVMGRILLGIVTLGYSEILYYTPKRFLLECREAAKDYDSGFFQNFAVGAKFAYFEACQTWAGQKLIGGAMKEVSSTQFGQALKEMAHEIHRDIRGVERSLCKNYSSINFVSKLARNGRKLAQMKIDGRLLGQKKLEIGKFKMESSPDLKELKAIAERAQKLGEAKVKQFIKACNDPNISPEELKKLVLSIQCDHFAKTYLNSAKVIDKYRFRFTTENTILHENVKRALKKQLAKDFGVPESQITFFEATGNATKVNAVNCKKIGMDHDYTIRVNGKDLPEEVAGRYWNDEYCYQATGDRMISPWDADYLGYQAEQTAVSSTGPESFGPSDVKKVIDPKGTATQAFDNPELVQKVQTYKIQEPLEQFERKMKEAALATDPRIKEVLEAQALMKLRDACRQLPKGMDRTLESKLNVVADWGKLDNLNPEKLRAAYELRGRIEHMLSRTSEGDSQALVELYASYQMDGKSLGKEAEKAFSLITEVDEIIAKGPDPSNYIRIREEDMEWAVVQSIKGGFHEKLENDSDWC